MEHSGFPSSPDRRATGPLIADLNKNVRALACKLSRAVRRCAILASAFALLAAPLSAPAQSSDADLAISKTGPNTAPADTDVAFLVTVTNAGPGTASNVIISDPIPAGMTFVSAVPNSGPAADCSGSPAPGATGTVTCSIATFASGATANFTFTLHIAPGTPAATTFVNVATVGSDTPDPNQENNSSSWGTSTPGTTLADVGIVKSGPSDVLAGSNIVYTITVTNNGPASAQSVTWNDTLPAPLTFVSLGASSPGGFACTAPAVGAGGTISCSTISMAAGAVSTFTLTANIPPGTASGTALLNSVAVTSANDPNPDNDSSVTVATVAASDLATVVAGPASVNAGAPLSYTVTLSNLGPDVKVAPTVVDITLPASATGASGSGSGWNCAPSSSSVISCSYGNLIASGAPVPPVTVSMTAPTNSGTAQISATAVFPADPNPGNNTSSASTNVIAQSNLSITKTSASITHSGQNIVYTIVVSNSGPSAAAGVTVNDPTPAGLTFVSNSGACSTPFPCNLGSLNAGQSATITATYSVAASFTGLLQNTASVSAATADPDNNNNSATASVSVLPAQQQLPIPALGDIGLLLMAALLALTQVLRQFKRKP